MSVPGAFAAAFPELKVVNHSETTLNSINMDTTAQAQGSTETLIPITSAESSKGETPVSALPKRQCSRLSRNDFFGELANLSRQRAELAACSKAMPATAHCSWSVFCNACDKPMADAHYHCDACDDGDYDLCETCVKAGTHCLSEDHWLVKRHVKNGRVVSSTTERHSPKQATQESVPDMPGTFTEHIEEKKPKVKEAVYEATRTCNCCVKGMYRQPIIHKHDTDESTEDKEGHFVTCLNCPDYDLCIPCHEANAHGHHPAHNFKAVGEEPLSPLSEFLCAPGRNAKHNALCNGCDKVSDQVSVSSITSANIVQPIFGTRHKCLNCPDWDYCSECVKNSSLIHPGHRFAPLFEPISAPHYRKARHVGIFCDGPLCENKSEYIEGTRYKCAICHDLDFCANCEAYPHNKHNHTHPLIQFKTPVRNATITTSHEDQFGRSLATKGDRGAAKAESSKVPANAATQVQTIIDVKPAEAQVYKPSKEKITIKDLLAEPICEKIKIQDLMSSPVQEPKRPADITQLNAVFVRETIPDGTVVTAEKSFTQVWTLRNSGPAAWPAGCSVRYTGGDNMLGGLSEVTESNVVDRIVEVGEEISFRVPLKAPANTGTKISYWRLKTMDGQAFGHRLWCHVNVTQISEADTIVAPASPVVEPAPHMAGPPVELPVRQAASSWKDTFLQQALQHRLERAQSIEKQRIELEKMKARHEAKQLADVQAKAHRTEMLRRLSSEVSAVEMQHKARVAAAKAAMDAARAAKAPMMSHPATELPAAPAYAGASAFEPMIDGQKMNKWQLQDYQMQLMLLEQQNKKRRLMQVQEQAHRVGESSRTPLGYQSFNPVPSMPMQPSQADLQLQMQLLEAQNRKRASMAAAEKVSESSSRAPMPYPVRSVPVEVEAEVRPVTVEDVADEEDIKPEAKSNMIFPKLDKESPVSSTVDVSAVPASPAPASEKSESEIFEDAESVSFIDSEDEQGFDTDEEYDILDASDEEFNA